MATSSIAEARKHKGFATIVASVDEVNAASLRVLEKLGLERIAPIQEPLETCFFYGSFAWIACFVSLDI
jgi:RimJ/RimL family protein N-acetyltransferase